jgi:hypothetical protein
MKNFLEHLTEVQKTYEFRIKLADVDPADLGEKLKSALDAYGLESLSEAKRLPIKTNDIDFPSMSNFQLFLMDAVLKYPVNDAQLRAIVSERVGIPMGKIVVVPKNHPEEIWRWDLEGNEIKEYVQGDAELVKPLPEATADQQAASKFYSEAGSLLKELNEVEVKVEGFDKTVGGEKNPADGKTTNDLPTGEASPVGSKQNTIPSPVKG